MFDRVFKRGSTVTAPVRDPILSNPELNAPGADQHELHQEDTIPEVALPDRTSAARARGVAIMVGVATVAIAGTGYFLFSGNGGAGGSDGLPPTAAETESIADMARVPRAGDDLESEADQRMSALENRMRALDGQTGPASTTIVDPSYAGLAGAPSPIVVDVPASPPAPVGPPQQVYYPDPPAAARAPASPQLDEALVRQLAAANGGQTYQGPGSSGTAMPGGGVQPQPPGGAVRPGGTATQAGSPASSATPEPSRPRMRVIRTSTSGARSLAGGGGEDEGATPEASAGSSGANGPEVRDVANYVAPNSYAPARVLTGVDASTGVTSTSEPKAVLLEITGPAITVNERGVIRQTDLTGCRINGAAYAELSSERVYVKILRMVCPVAGGRVAISSVEGFVAQRGRAGVRGPVVSRAGDFTQRAFIAGMAGGLGQGLSLNVQRAIGGVNTTVGGDALGAQRLSSGDIATGMVGGGAASAASMLSQYYIQRAEQVQPTVEMSAGQEVEIVFLSGTVVR